ncbi:MAG TPA: GntR family transcriptional regulator [Marinilabiliaceae bacterium]|nr:GntR family transcriptional regulator [Marinilabiliaceae bacterium]
MEGSARLNNFRFKISEKSGLPKFRQIVDSVNDAVAENQLIVGDHLPSVNQICQDYKISRDTVFKAYTLLKEQGVVDSVPNKGYFIAKAVRRVFLFLDTFKAYKEVLYDSFIKNLPKSILAEVHFHHYKPDVFKRQIEESIGKYAKYVVMPFDHDGMEDILSLIPDDKLLIIDWNIHTKESNNLLYQDFGKSVYEGLEEVLPLLTRYKKFEFLYPEYTNHPYETVSFFEKFCKDHKIKYSVLTDSTKFNVEQGKAYFSVSDRMLGKFLEQCRSKNLEPGTDTGIISYNETPMKKFIYKGITVITTDFDEMGRKAAEFVVNDSVMTYCVPTHVYIRESL